MKLPARRAGLTGHVPAKGDRSVIKGPAQKDFRNHEGSVQNPGRKKVRGRPYRLFRLQDQGGRADQEREKAVEFLVDVQIPFNFGLTILVN